MEIINSGHIKDVTALMKSLETTPATVDGFALHPIVLEILRACFETDRQQRVSGILRIAGQLAGLRSLLQVPSVLRI